MQSEDVGLLNIKTRRNGIGVKCCSLIIIGGHTDLHIILSGTLKTHRYAEEIISSHDVTYAAVISDSFPLMHDNVIYTCGEHAWNVKNMEKGGTSMFLWFKYFRRLCATWSIAPLTVIIILFCMCDKLLRFSSTLQ